MSVSVTIPISDRIIFGLTSSCFIWEIALFIASEDPWTSDLIIIFNSSNVLSLKAESCVTNVNEFFPSKFSWTLASHNDLASFSFSKTINQIKNVAQEEKIKPEVQTEIKAENKININVFEDLIEICSKKKEIKLKYELEKNVNLVKFEKNRIEISFNESLDKDFVKDLSSKLFEWTGERWIITFSKLKGQMSVKDKEKNVKKQLMDEMKNSEIFKSVMDKFPDAELIDVNSNKDGVDNDWF